MLCPSTNNRIYKWIISTNSVSESDDTTVLIHYWSTSTVSWFYLPIVFDWYFPVAVIDHIWWWALVGNRHLINLPPAQWMLFNLIFLIDWLNTTVCFEQCFVLRTSSAGRLGLILLLPWVFRSVSNNCLIWKLLFVNLHSSLLQNGQHGQEHKFKMN